MPDRNHPSKAVQPDESIKEAYHGAIDPSEMIRRGLDPDQVIDFSTNVNPFGPSPRVREAVCNCVLDRYPDRQCLRLRECIAAHEAVAIDRIIVGNGSSELLQSLAQLFCGPATKS
jgi:histidinol-phosphate/aromatic aminotransferase/cobyric acid decarboxylase-like protein